MTHHLPSLFVLTLVSLAVASCREDGPAEPQSLAGPEPGPSASSPVAAAPADLIAGQYIVVFRRDVGHVQSAAQSILVRHGGNLKRTYSTALKGMVLQLSDAELARVRRDPAVESVEQDQVVRAEESGALQNGDLGQLPSVVAVQPNAPWGLDRLDHRFIRQSTYRYEPRGVGVRAYIIDTGIKFDHNDFGSPSRASPGFDAFSGTGVDCHGQGTHLAGTVGGTIHGAAKLIQLVAVRILDCAGSGTVSGAIAGVDWVTANRVLPAVAVMAINVFHGSTTLNTAVNNSIASGVTYAVSSGNSPFNGCGSSPGAVANALTIAASNMSDAFASFSAFGACIDLEAPGVDIVSAGIASTSATATRSGGGMGAAHTAGVAAQFLETTPGATPAQVASALTNNATSGLLTSVPSGTPNRLLYNGFMKHNSWDLLQLLPQPPRTNLAAAAANGLIYAIGGLAPAGVIADVASYNPGNNTWSPRAPLPAARHSSNGAATIGGLIYTSGGLNSAGNLTRNLYVYDPGTNTWAIRAPMPVAGGCGVTGVIAGQLYVFSGCSGATGATNAGLLHRYDPGTNTWTALASAPAAHRYPAGGVISSRFYVVGGRSNASASTTTLHRYNPGTNAWATRAAMPTARRAAAGAVVSGSILYVMGGRDAAGTNLITMDAYTPGTNSWASRAQLNEFRSGLAAAAAGGLLYNLGGQNNSGFSTANFVYRP